MKKAILLFVLLAVSGFAFAQKKSKKLTAEESAKMTPDQRVVYENERTEKRGKKTAGTKVSKKQREKSLKKKIKTEEKQDHKARKIKSTRNGKRY